MAIQFEYLKQISEKFFQQENAATQPDSQRLCGKRILLVEDNRVHQLMIGIMLTNLGMHLEVVENGAVAIEAIKTGNYDLVLMDIQMPVMNGLEATRRLRQHAEFKRLPIVGMSAGMMQDEPAETARAGMNGFVAKPVNMTKLTSELLNACA
ncbi:response regulator [Gallionella capsiferriformans]|uniref:Response regulator receiver protein n=1 Tax=Gallionella capsiferriformans (strain ES-2) TaxID=395494 RepID=D9SH92_GALCS|nr:response regulator [Gallionella capsiferriformans]ADL55889.1 response regulator receiver protein [Gallionella capsiferriformans ES-2]